MRTNKSKINGPTLFDAFNTGRDKVTSAFALVEHIRKTMPGFTIAITYPGEEMDKVGAVTMYVSPPSKFKDIKAAFIIAKDDKELVQKATGGVHRMIRDISASEVERAVDNGETYEYVERERKRAGRVAVATAAMAAKATTPKPRAKRGVRPVAAIG